MHVFMKGTWDPSPLLSPPPPVPSPYCASILVTFPQTKQSLDDRCQILVGPYGGYVVDYQHRSSSSAGGDAIESNSVVAKSTGVAGSASIDANIRVRIRAEQNTQRLERLEDNVSARFI